MKISKAVQYRLVLILWGAIAGVTLYIAKTQDADPMAVAYMAKVTTHQVASK